MTSDELKEIKLRAEKATPGPWYAHQETWADGYNEGRCIGITTSSNKYKGKDIVVTDDGVYPPEPPDAKFIAHARTDIPALLAEIERLRDGVVEAFRDGRHVHKWDEDYGAVWWEEWANGLKPGHPLRPTDG